MPGRDRACENARRVAVKAVRDESSRKVDRAGGYRNRLGEGNFGPTGRAGDRPSADDLSVVYSQSPTTRSVKASPGG